MCFTLQDKSRLTEETVELPCVDEFDDDNDSIHEQVVQADSQQIPCNREEKDNEDAYYHPDANLLQTPAVPDNNQCSQRQVGQRQGTGDDKTDLGQGRLKEDGDKTDDVEHQDNDPQCRERVIQAFHATHRGVIHGHHTHRVDERNA